MLVRPSPSGEGAVFTSLIFFKGVSCLVVASAFPINRALVKIVRSIVRLAAKTISRLNHDEIHSLDFLQ